MDNTTADAALQTMSAGEMAAHLHTAMAGKRYLLTAPWAGTTHEHVSRDDMDTHTHLAAQCFQRSSQLGTPLYPQGTERLQCSQDTLSHTTSPTHKLQSMKTRHAHMKQADSEGAWRLGSFVCLSLKTQTDTQTYADGTVFLEPEGRRSLVRPLSSSWVTMTA